VSDQKILKHLMSMVFLPNNKYCIYIKLAWYIFYADNDTSKTERYAIKYLKQYRNWFLLFKIFTFS